MEPKEKLWLPAIVERASGAAAPHRGEPSLWEVLSMLVMMFMMHLLAVCRVTSFWEAAEWLDNTSYVEIARTIRQWHSASGWIPQHFWGFPYVIAVVAKLLAIRELTAIAAISLLGSLAVCILVHRLYGGWVTAVFIFINYQWIEISVEGGSEPLFICLLCASFLAARSNRWNLAALLAALSTTVRPVGIFALLSLAAVLALRRSYRQLSTITLIGLGIGILYIVPLWILYGSPFTNFIQYRGDWGARGWPLTYPFHTLLASYLQFVHMDVIHWYTFANFALCLSLALVGTAAMWLFRTRQDFPLYQTEILFASLYTLFLISYNYLYIVGDFPRFLLPIVPILLYSLVDWIPRVRPLIWVGAVLSALLSAAARVGFENVIQFRSP
jgi:hypothetical protein